MDWQQLRTILWLRWKLTLNQWARGGNWGAVLAILLAVAAVTGATLAFGGALLLGILVLGDSSSARVFTAWDIAIGAFLVFWVVGLVTELHRSESIDLQRLMYLPVRLGQIFTVNYVASHLVPSIVLCLPAMIGLAVGLAMSRGAAMLLLVPLVIASVFMITAWTYCLRGWLAALMTNPRRRRSALVIVSMVLVLIGQLPNIYFNLLSRGWEAPPPHSTPEQIQAHRRARMARQRQTSQQLAGVHRFVPPLWLPLAAKSLAERQPWPAVAATAGCLLIGAAGLRRAYGSTVRFYQGGTTTRKAKAAPPPRSGAVTRGTMLVERRVPGLNDEAAAVALSTFTSMLRAPEVRMQWATSVIMTIVFAAMALRRSGASVPAPWKPVLVLGLDTMVLFMLIQALANQFGFDRAGFRTFVLAPINRRNVLLGKNLASLPAAMVLVTLVTISCSIWLHLPVTATVMVLLEFTIMFALVCMLGNILSITAPYRIRAGSMKPTKLPAKAQLVLFLSHMLFPVVMAPAFIPALAQAAWSLAEWPHFPIGLVAALVLASAAIAAYWLSLAPLARMLERRETKILDTLGTEVE